MKEIDPITLTATEWNTVKDKVKFAKHFQKFVTNGFKQTMFPDWFYTRLSMTFGHIAHYSRHGFYETFFTNDCDKNNFIQQCLSGGGYGDPAYTYSDVERYLKEWLKNRENKDDGS